MEVNLTVALWTRRNSGICYRGRFPGIHRTQGHCHPFDKPTCLCYLELSGIQLTWCGTTGSRENPSNSWPISTSIPLITRDTLEGPSLWWAWPRWYHAIALIPSGQIQQRTLCWSEYINYSANNVTISIVEESSAVNAWLSLRFNDWYKRGPWLWSVGHCRFFDIQILTINPVIPDHPAMVVLGNWFEPETMWEPETTSELRYACVRFSDENRVHMIDQSCIQPFLYTLGSFSLVTYCIIRIT